jgi:stage V sporulation protein R
MRDVMLFLLEHAPLKPWQADVLSIIRDEAYYFAPQGQTKIMNEGWATYWHSTIMTRHGLEPIRPDLLRRPLRGTLAGSPTRLNPYKLGVELFRDIEDRWNRGAFGEEFDECDDYRAARLGQAARPGARKDLRGPPHPQRPDVHRRVPDARLLPPHKLFSFGYNEDSGYYEIESREFDKVKQRLLFNLTNMGRPIIYVVDGNYKNRGELLLEHRYSGVELQSNYAQDTLSNLYKLWKRPVHIELAFVAHSKEEATMTIRIDIERELKRIQAVSGKGLLQVDLPTGRIEADLLAVDAIGCSFQTLAYSTDKLAGASLDD